MTKYSEKLKKLGSYSLPGLFLLVFFISMSVGTFNLNPKEFFTSIFSDTPNGYILRSLRFPRVLMSLLTGIALSSVGLVYQSIMKNPLVDPYLIGTSTGASFGYLLGIYINVNTTYMVNTSLLAFAFSMLASLLTIALARKEGIIPATHLVLSGILVSTFFSSANLLITNLSKRQLIPFHSLLFGTFSGITINDIYLPTIALVIFVVFGYIFGPHLDAFSLGEKEAKSLGVNVEFLKWGFYLLGALVVSLFVSKSGIIGFVGLVVPHIARLLVGPRHRKSLLATILVGGMLLMICDTLARTIIQPVEIPVGIITSFIGVPFMFVLMKKRMR